MALPTDRIVFESTPSSRDDWVWNRFKDRPLLSPTSLLSAQPKDSICLRLPWGQIRNFMVPAADPRNPVYQFLPPDERQAELAEELWRDLRGGVAIAEMLPDGTSRRIDPRDFYAGSEER